MSGEKSKEGRDLFVAEMSTERVHLLNVGLCRASAPLAYNVVFILQ